MVRWGSAVLALALLAPAQGASAADSRMIPAGTSAGGVAVGGLTVDRATARLRSALGRRARTPVAVRVAGRRFVLSARRARVRLDARRTAERALAAGRRGESRVAPAVSFSGRAAAHFVRNIARRVGRRARSASVRITVRRMVKRRARVGLAINRKRVLKRVRVALANPRSSHSLHVRRRGVRPRVTGRELRRRYATVVTVDKRRFKLRLFKHLRHAKTYGIAIGMAGYETPPGRYRIRDKQVDPAWHAPNRPWAGAMAGKVVPGGAPSNPLKARWLGIAGGVGIHGTAEEWSIGTRASHGCIRMRVREVVRLYPRVPVGTAVLIR